MSIVDREHLPFQTSLYITHDGGRNSKEKTSHLLLDVSD